MTALREAAQQALEALDEYAPQHGRPDDMMSAITALRAVLAQEQAEPVVGWMDPESEDVVSAAQRAVWAQDFGVAGRRKAGRFTIPLRACLAQEQAEPDLRLANPIGLTPHQKEVQRRQLQAEPEGSVCARCGALAFDPVVTQQAALAEPAQEPVAWMGAYDKTELYYRKPPQADVVPLYTAPPKAEPAQEPVTWVASEDGCVIYDDISMDDVVLRVSGDFENDEQRIRCAKRIVDALNAAPPRRTMVPLTEEEIDHAANNILTDDPVQWWRKLARAIEKASWEKNHG